MEEIIDIAVGLEKNGETFYRQAAETHTDPLVVSRLLWLADEEAQHAETFAAMKATVKIDVVDASLAEMGRKLFQQTIDGQGFSLTAKALSQVDDTTELIALAIEFEKDTVIFYEMLQPFLDDPKAEALINTIIAEEKSHIEQLQTLQVVATP